MKYPRPGHQLVLAVTLLTACGRGGTKGSEPPSPSNDGATSASSTVPAAGSAGLGPEARAKVLAKVGDQEITLGQFVAALEAMDPFERMRYETPERKKKLLEEMVDLHLLANEARSQGLDRDPETQERVRQVLRDEMLRRVAAKVPAPETVSERDARAYYEDHREEFTSPERRRVAVVELNNRGDAEKLLPKALAATPSEWGALVKSHGPSASELGAEAPELAGDLGFVTAPGEKRGQNARIPEAVRQAAFEIEAVGKVHSKVISVGERHFIVRLVSKNDAGRRSFEEAERSVRIRVTEDRLRNAEKAYETELAQKYPLRIDETALAGLASQGDRLGKPVASSSANKGPGSLAPIGSGTPHEH